MFSLLRNNSATRHQHHSDPLVMHIRLRKISWPSGFTHRALARPAGLMSPILRSDRQDWSSLALKDLTKTVVVWEMVILAKSSDDRVGVKVVSRQPIVVTTSDDRWKFVGLLLKRMCWVHFETSDVVVVKSFVLIQLRGVVDCVIWGLMIRGAASLAGLLLLRAALTFPIYGHGQTEGENRLCLSALDLNVHLLHCDTQCPVHWLIRFRPSWLLDVTLYNNRTSGLNCLPFSLCTENGRWNCRPRCWQRIWYVQSWLCRGWCSTCRVPLHRWTPQASGTVSPWRIWSCKQTYGLIKWSNVFCFAP